MEKEYSFQILHGKHNTLQLSIFPNQSIIAQPNSINYMSEGIITHPTLHQFTFTNKTENIGYIGLSLEGNQFIRH